MIKNSFFKRSTWVLILVSLACGLGFPLLSVSRDSRAEYNFSQAFVLVREKGIEPGSFTTEIVLVALVLALFLIFLSNAALEDFKILKSYVMIRMKSLNKWTFSHMALLGIYSFLSSAFYHLGLLLFCAAFGFRMKDWENFIFLFLYAVITTFLVEWIVSIPVSFLSLRTSQKNAVFSGILFFLLSGAGALLLPKKAVPYFWFSHYFVSWHEPSSRIMMALNGGFVENGLNASFAFSLLFLLGIAVLEIGIYRKLVQKIDFI